MRRYIMSDVFSTAAPPVSKTNFRMARDSGLGYRRTAALARFDDFTTQGQGETSHMRLPGLIVHATRSSGFRPISLCAINAPALFHPIPPIPGAATSVCHSNDFRTAGGFSKNDQVGKPPKQHSARAERVFRKLPGVISNSFDGAVKLIHEHFRSPHTAPPVPFDGCFGFVQSLRVKANGCVPHCSNRDRRRRRASSQGMSRTAPLSICWRRR